MAIEDPIVAQIQLGILLRRIREDADRTALEASRHLGCSTAKMSKVENGRQSITPDEVAALLDLYGANDAQSAEALKLASVPRPRRHRRSASYRDAVPNWFRRLLVLESEAGEITAYENELVLGLFQIEDYARILLQAGDPLAGSQEIDRQVATRINRQAMLTRTDPAPPQLDVILHEATLRRVIGSDAIMRKQLRRLLELSKLPNIRLQVLPFRPKPRPGHDEAFAAKTSFRLLKLPDRGSVLYLEDFTGATYPEDIAVIQQFAAAYQRLRAAAEDPTESRKLIARLAKEYE